MKFLRLTAWCAALCLSTTLLQAQNAADVEDFKRQLKEATDKFEKVIREQREQIDALNKRLDAFQAAMTNQPPGTNQPSVAQRYPEEEKRKAAEKRKTGATAARKIAQQGPASNTAPASSLDGVVAF